MPRNRKSTKYHKIGIKRLLSFSEILCFSVLVAKVIFRNKNKVECLKILGDEDNLYWPQLRGTRARTEQ